MIDHKDFTLFQKPSSNSMVCFVVSSPASVRLTSTASTMSEPSFNVFAALVAQSKLPGKPGAAARAALIAYKNSQKSFVKKNTVPAVSPSVKDSGVQVVAPSQPTVPPLKHNVGKDELPTDAPPVPPPFVRGVKPQFPQKPKLPPPPPPPMDADELAALAAGSGPTVSPQYNAMRTGAVVASRKAMSAAPMPNYVLLVETQMVEAITAMNNAIATGDKLEKLQFFNNARAKFSSAIYGATNNNYSADALERSAKVAEIRNFMTTINSALRDEYGIKATNDREIRNAIKSQLDKLENASVKKAQEIVGKNVPESSPTEVPQIYPSFVAPTDKDLTYQAFAERLVESGKMKPVKSLMMPDNMRKAFKYNPVNSIYKSDKEMYAFLHQQKAISYLNPALSRIRANGTVAGVANRMISKLISPEKAKKFIRIDKQMVARLQTILPWNVEQAKDYLATRDPPSLHRREYEHALTYINGMADAGFPYLFEKGFETDTNKVCGVTCLADDYILTNPTKDAHGVPFLPKARPVLEHAMIWTNRLDKMVKRAKSFPDLLKSWFELLKTNPELNTCMLKRKCEKMPRDEYLTKVRPYGVQPLAVRLLGKYYLYTLDHYIKNFFEDVNSISAYKFSPFVGGATRLVKHYASFVPKDKSQVYMRAISYGDDQLWAFYFPDGSVVIWGPDVNAMDMSTSGECVHNFAAVLSAYDVPGFVKIELLFAMYLAFHHDLFIGGCNVLHKDHSLLSGFPGTTLFNIFNSATMIVVVEKKLVELGNKYNTSAEFSLLAEELKAEITAQMNYTFKPDSLSSVHSYATIADIEREGVVVPFLSARYLPYTQDEVSGYVAVPEEIDKFTASLVLPNANKITNELRLSIILGNYITGAWCDVIFADILRKAYKHYLSAGIISEEFKDVEDLDDGVRYMITYFGVKLSWGLPSRQYMIDFNLLSWDDLKNKYPQGWKESVLQKPIDEEHSVVVQPPEVLFSPVAVEEAPAEPTEFDYLDFNKPEIVSVVEEVFPKVAPTATNVAEKTVTIEQMHVAKMQERKEKGLPISKVEKVGKELVVGRSASLLNALPIVPEFLAATLGVYDQPPQVPPFNITTPNISSSSSSSFAEPVATTVRVDLTVPALQRPSNAVAPVDLGNTTATTLDEKERKFQRWMVKMRAVWEARDKMKEARKQNQSRSNNVVDDNDNSDDNDEDNNQEFQEAEEFEAPNDDDNNNNDDGDNEEQRIDKAEQVAEDMEKQKDEREYNKMGDEEYIAWLQSSEFGNQFGYLGE